MTLNQIEIFTELAEERNFSSVAHKLGVTQPAISNAIKKMESELRTTLISRFNKDFTLTEEGNTILQYCEEIMTQVRNINNESRVKIQEEKSKLTLGAVWSANNKLLPKFINYFKRKNPLVKLAILEGSDEEIERWVEDDIVDIGIFSWTNKKLRQYVVAEDDYYLVVSKRNKLSLVQCVQLKDICSQPVIISDAGCGPLILELFKSKNLDIEINYHVRELMTILAMVNENMAVSIIPQLAIPSGYDKLKFIPIDLEHKLRRKLYLSFKRDSPNKAAILNFKDSLEAYLN